jgi:hypothetical protein
MENTNSTVTLTIKDLGSIKDIIELACTRGAFRANELKTVGDTYDRLDAFLSAILAQAEAEKSATEANQQGEQP